jgi:hypothetical protein
MVKSKDRWSALSIQQRADLIKLYTSNGITNIKDIRKHYNSFGYGGDTSWEDVDKFVEKAEPWVSGTSLAATGTALAISAASGETAAPVALPVAATIGNISNGAGVLIDGYQAVKDVSNGIREAYNKRFDTGATVLDAVFDTTDVGEGVFSKFKDEHPIEIYKFGGVLNTFDDGGSTNTISKKSLIRDFMSNFKGFDPTSLISTVVPILASNQKEEVISNEELSKELNIDPNLNTFVVPDELSERTFVSKVNDRIKEKTNNELRDEIESKSKDEIIEIQSQLASEGYYDFQLKKGKSKQATEIQKRLVKEGLLDTTEVDGNIGEQTITALQALLVSKGYLPEYTDSGKTNIDGLLGKHTQEAFKLYNRDYNIDGIAGNKTIEGYIKKESVKNKGFNTYVSAEGMQDACAKWVTKKYDTVAGNSMQNGVIGNAWQMIKNVEDRGGKSIFNIYENPLFDNVSSPQEVKQAVNTYLQNNKIDYSSLQAGDVVGIHNPSSDHYSEVLESGTTYNTHVGIVVDVENGIPIIEHNILGNVRRERIDKLTGSKTGRPVVTAASRPVQGERVKGNLEFDNIMSDLKLPTNPNEQMKEYMNSLASSKRVFKEIYPEVDMDFIEKVAVAITKRETNFMEDKMSDVKKGSAGIKSAASAYLRDIAHNIKGTPEEAKSRDLTKMKFSSLSSNYREAIGLYSPEQLDNDPTITGRATMLLLSKNYDYFVRFAKENPELKLTEEDIRNATILSYNRGLGSVSSLGFDIKKDSITGEIQYVPDFNEIKYLRDKSKPGAKEKDFTSTNLRHLNKISSFAGILGKMLYDKYGDEHVSYMASANKIIENL